MVLNHLSRSLYTKLHPLLTANIQTRCLLARNYHEKVIDHYENPRNVGSFDKSNDDIGTGLVGAPACGDVMKLQIKVDENGKITDAKFKTFGCGSAIASSSLATEWIKGKSIKEANSIKNQDIAKELCLPPVKLHCSNMRVTEKHLRDEVYNRCIEFLDVTINFILYIEQIYSKDIFEKRFKYNQIVYECQDVDVQHYIYEFLNQIKPLFRKQLVDQIGFVITTTNEKEILRRYLIELHPILEHSSNTIHTNGNHQLAELDSMFSTCLIELMKQMPISPLSLFVENDNDDELRWKLQMRLCHHGNNKFEIDETFYEQFKLTINSSLSLRQIKSTHAQRLNIQFMCQENKTEK
ncbi:hypothetical protein I4U23_003037 [Adineta vaga]|nr:hypothetical protein I4U23_003037 [Adineta vaga]